MFRSLVQFCGVLNVFSSEGEELGRMEKNDTWLPMGLAKLWEILARNAAWT